MVSPCGVLTFSQREKVAAKPPDEGFEWKRVRL
jgi:hypothetical protein